MSQFLSDILINYLKDMANRGDDEAKVLLKMIEDEDTNHFTLKQSERIQK